MSTFSAPASAHHPLLLHDRLLSQITETSSPSVVESTFVSLLERVRTQWISHCTTWQETCIVQDIGGETVSGSMITFYMFAISMRPVLDRLDWSKTKRLREYDRIQLLEVFVHDEGLRVQEMTQGELMDCLEGLDWLVFSDRFFHDRDVEWWDQVKECLLCLTLRCVDLLAASTTLSSRVLNMPEYTQKHKWSLFSGGEEEKEKEKDDKDDKDWLPQQQQPNEEKKRKKQKVRLGPRAPPSYSFYANNEDEDQEAEKTLLDASSDEETPHKKPPRRPAAAAAAATTNNNPDHALSVRLGLGDIMEIKQVSVNFAWVHDVDAFLTHFWLRAFEYDRIHSLFGAAAATTAGTTKSVVVGDPQRAFLFPKMRDFLFRWVQGLEQQDEAVRVRRTWYEDLIVTNVHRRIFRRHSPFHVRAAAREILVFKKECLAQPHCTTLADMLTEQTNAFRYDLERLTIDSLFFMHSRTLSSGSGTGDVCAAVMENEEDGSNVTAPLSHTMMMRKSQNESFLGGVNVGYSALSDRPPKLPYIRLDRISNLFKVCFAHETTAAAAATEKDTSPPLFLYAPSFTEAFGVMRREMLARHLPPEKRLSTSKALLSVYDNSFGVTHIK